MPTFSKQGMLNSSSCNKNTAIQAGGYNQAERLQETGSQRDILIGTQKQKSTHF